MANSVELCVGEFIPETAFNVLWIFGMAGSIYLEGKVCFILIPLCSKYHYISSYNFNSWHSLGD